MPGGFLNVPTTLQPAPQPSPSHEGQRLLRAAVGRLSSSVTAPEMNVFYNVIITVLFLIFYCLLSPLCEADPVIHLSDQGGGQPCVHSPKWLQRAHKITRETEVQKIYLKKTVSSEGLVYGICFLAHQLRVCKNTFKKPSWK